MYFCEGPCEYMHERLTLLVVAPEAPPACFWADMEIM